MEGDIPDIEGFISPGVFVDVETLSTGSSVPGGIRVAAIIGEGLTAQTLVASALGGGLDGLNPTYTSSNGSDGRHFRLGSFPVVSNRTTLFRNGFLLNGFETIITPATTFPDTYDYA